MPQQIRTLTGKSPLERLEQSLQMANEGYAQQREQEFTIGQELQKRAKKRKEESFVQGNVQSLLEKAMTPDEKGKPMDEPTLKSEVFKTGLALMLGGGETGREAAPILEKLATTMYPVRKTAPKYKPQFDEKGNPITVKVGEKTVALEYEIDPATDEIKLGEDNQPIPHFSKITYQPSGGGKPRKDQDPEEAKRVEKGLLQQIYTKFSNGKGGLVVDLNGILQKTAKVPKERIKQANKMTGKTEFIEGTKEDPTILKWVDAYKKRKMLNPEEEDISNQTAPVKDEKDLTNF